MRIGADSTTATGGDAATMVAAAGEKAGKVRNGIVNRRGTLLYEAAKHVSFPALASPPTDDADDRRLRRQLLRLDGRCEYCETRPATTTDHFEPLVRDRAPTPFCNDLWNSIPCCKECNSSKGGRSYDAWFASRCRYNPCSSSKTGADGDRDDDDDETDENEDGGERRRTREGGGISRLRVKFAMYDVAFRARSCRKRVDAEAWGSVRARVDAFLESLQAQVERLRLETPVRRLCDDDDGDGDGAEEDRAPIADRTTRRDPPRAVGRVRADGIAAFDDEDEDDRPLVDRLRAGGR